MKTTIAWLCIAAVIAALIVRFFVVGVSLIPQNGMFPNFPAGTRVVTLKHPYEKVGDVHRGDVIAYVQAIGGAQYKFIWRVVALPGELVETHAGHVVVNGSQAVYRPVTSAAAQNQSLFEEHFGNTAYTVAFAPGSKPVPDVSFRVPANSFFVLGDNRNNAADSRLYGSVPFSGIVGKAIWSW